MRGSLIKNYYFIFINYLFVVSAFSAFGKSIAKPFEILSYPEKKCVFAPSAKTKEEKTATMIAAAKKLLSNSLDAKGFKELCLAFIKPEGKYSGGVYINAYGYPGSGFETINPGKITWSTVNNNTDYQVLINEGFERPDSYQFVQSMLRHLKDNIACNVKDEVEGCLPPISTVFILI